MRLSKSNLLDEIRPPTRKSESLPFAVDISKSCHDLCIGMYLDIINDEHKIDKFANICKTTDDDTYWDDNPFQGANNIEVRQITLDNVATTWQGTDGAVCFSKNDRWYSGAPQLQSGTGDQIFVDSNLFVCRRTNQ